jgi:hypothetical protein
MLALAGCEVAARSDGARLPEGSAGRVLGRAIDAAGGWKRWSEIDDVALVTSFSLYDPAGNLASQSIGVLESPLHQPPRGRFESIGLPEPVTIGFDGKETWLEKGGKVSVPEPERMALARFNIVSDLFWFSLPFALAEIPATVTDLGPESDGDHRWNRLRVTLDERAPEAPADWLIVYFDERTGLIDQVLGHVPAEFLPHHVWLGRWSEYQDRGGLQKERRRQFFPADEDGHVIGGLAVEKLVEDVRFDNHFSPARFVKPLAAGGGSLT